METYAYKFVQTSLTIYTKWLPDPILLGDCYVQFVRRTPWFGNCEPQHKHCL